MEQFKYIAPCLFGTEGVLGDELRRMELGGVEAQNGRVLFTGGFEALARANINSRFAERILINVGEFEADSFVALFDGVTALPWENFIGREDAFPVKGWSLHSQLHSIPDCQSIIKKAIVERLKKAYRITWFCETGVQLRVRFSILKNHVTLMLDTSGEGLHKRGYRRNANEAPLKETLAATICDLARIYPDTQLYDPFCGSGTILIEAAMMAAKIAPGLRRAFAAERYSFVPAKVWQTERMRAQDLIQHGISFCAYGSDIDNKAIELTRENAKKAGVSSYIKVRQAPFAEFHLPEGRMTLVTNPPYGERMLDVQAAEALYCEMGKCLTAQAGKKYFILSPDDAFESFFGRPADKRRKLYNGMIACQLFCYFKGKAE